MIADERKIIEDFIKEWNNSDSFITAHTSGSTGTPKAIQLSKYLVVQSAIATCQFFNIPENKRLHSCVSCRYIGGKMVVIRGLANNCEATFEVPSNTPYLYNDFTSLVNSEYSRLYHKIANNPKSTLHDIPIEMASVVASQMPWILANLATLPRVNTYLIGGGTIPADIRRMIINHGVNAWESYGMTETASHIAVRRVSLSTDEVPFSLMPDVSVELDSRGCLVVRRDGFEPIFTNDIGTITEDGKILIHGRIDNVIVSGGLKFHPEKAEELLSNLLPFPFFFRGRPDKKWGEAVEMVIEVSEEISSDSERDGHADSWSDQRILNILENHLEHWQLPKNIVRVKALPRTPNGKIKRSLD